jgi:phenylalanyl-tRNA synthetase beta chain
MKLTFNWLKELVEINDTPQEVARLLTMAGIEVESLSRIVDEKGAEDWVIEVAVAANRGDCLGVLGLAREVAALTGSEVRLPAALPHDKDPELDEILRITVEAPELCPRYSARMVSDISVHDSPLWLRARLEACGIRSINNVVDVTNLVMLETGQPLHAFDWDRLRAKRIVVRRAKDIKCLTTLDGAEQKLEAGDLLICDGPEPIALAGIMGGLRSEVGPGTRHLLLESAHFDPLTIRRTAKRLGLHTEASHRFERVVDRSGTVYALGRAAFLLSEVTGGNPSRGVVDSEAEKKKVQPIRLRDARVKSLLGVDLERADVERILKSLGARTAVRSDTEVEVYPPYYRADLSREVDLVEEIARLHGYNKIPTKLPLVKPGGKADVRLRWERRLRSFLVGEGLTEVINLTFASPEMNRRFGGLWDGAVSPVELLNPLNQETSEMRLSLLPSLLGSLRSHVEQKVRSFWAFEMGRAFSRLSREQTAQKELLSGLLYGARERRGLQADEKPVTFFDLKGVVEGILELMGLAGTVAWDAGAVSFLHPGKAGILKLSGSRAGVVGEIHPDLRGQSDLPPVFVFELDFETLLQYARDDLVIRPLPRFPSVERDLALVVEELLPAQQVVSWIQDLHHPLIEQVQVFDEYRGPQIGEGKKSLAYKISYRAEDRTLTDSEINDIHQSLAEKIVRDFNGQIRR